MCDGVNEIKGDKNDKFIEEEDDNYTDVPSPGYIEEGVENMTMSLLLIVWIEV